MATARRQAELVLCFSKSDSDLLRQQLPASVRITTDRFGEYFEVVSSGEMSGDAAETHLEWLWVKSEPFVELIEGREARPTARVLRVIQYVSADDDIGPGLPVEEKSVAAVARL